VVRMKVYIFKRDTAGDQNVLFSIVLLVSGSSRVCKIEKCSKRNEE
jgi:hypothetical protein